MERRIVKGVIALALAQIRLLVGILMKSHLSGWDNLLVVAHPLVPPSLPLFGGN
jgi:hypothetical protein